MVTVIRANMVFANYGEYFIRNVGYKELYSVLVDSEGY
jgi:hypothetical protein